MRDGTKDFKERKKKKIHELDSLDFKPQLCHQSEDDKETLRIIIDCPPGEPRPLDVFASVIKGTDLTLKDFLDPDAPIFGVQLFRVKADSEAIARYLEARKLIAKRMNMLISSGVIRAGSF